MNGKLWNYTFQGKELEIIINYITKIKKEENLDIFKDIEKGRNNKEQTIRLKNTVQSSP
jgi:hypothetical protein